MKHIEGQHDQHKASEGVTKNCTGNKEEKKLAPREGAKIIARITSRSLRKQTPSRT